MIPCYDINGFKFVGIESSEVNGVEVELLVSIVYPTLKEKGRWIAKDKLPPPIAYFNRK